MITNRAQFMRVARLTKLLGKAVATLSEELPATEGQRERIAAAALRIDEAANEILEAGHERERRPARDGH